MQRVVEGAQHPRHVLAAARPSPGARRASATARPRSRDHPVVFHQQHLRRGGSRRARGCAGRPARPRRARRCARAAPRGATARCRRPRARPRAAPRGGARAAPGRVRACAWARRAQPATSSAPTGSGSNAGIAAAPGEDARAARRCAGPACGRAPGSRRAPRARAPRRGRAPGSARSSAPGTRACTPSRRPGSRRTPAAARAWSSRPSSEAYSTLPATGTQLGKCATSVRKRPISTSGLTPGLHAPVALEEQPVAQRRRACCCSAPRPDRHRAARAGASPASSPKAEVGSEAQPPPWPSRRSLAARRSPRPARGRTPRRPARRRARRRWPAGAPWRWRPAASARTRSSSALLPGERERHEVARAARRRLALHEHERDQPRALAALPHRSGRRGCTRADRLALGARTSAAPRCSAAAPRARAGRARFSAMPHAPRHHAVAEEARPAVEQHQHRQVLARQRAPRATSGHVLVGGEAEPVEAVGRAASAGRAARRSAGRPCARASRPARGP